MTRTLGVALVSREYPPFFGGGIGTYARWAVPALRDAGVRVHVVTEAHDATEPRVTVDRGVTVHRVPMGIGRGGWTNAALRFSINAGRRVATLAAAGELDVAEFAECEAAGVATGLMRRERSSVPFLVHLHTASEQLLALRSLPGKRLDASMAAYIQAERLALASADRVVAPSLFIASWATARYGLPEVPTVIPYAIGPIPRETEPSAEERVLFVGRIEPRKGVEVLARAWPRVLSRCPGATLHLAGADTSGAQGGGSMRAFLESLWDAETRATVRFMGRLRASAVARAYRDASVCVVPSLWENFPNTCIEAMTHARSVVVSETGGMAEMIGETRAGRVFCSGDPDSLAEALVVQLQAGPERWASDGRVARSRIAELCDPARVAAARVALYQETVERARRGSPARAGALRSWLGIERIAAGEVPDSLVPALSGGAARWTRGAPA